MKYSCPSLFFTANDGDLNKPILKRSTHSSHFSAFLPFPRVRAMKVSPIKQTLRFNKDIQKTKKVKRNLFFVFHMLATYLGFGPFKANKVTRELSFKWFSWDTLLCLIRLVALNSPLSILPIVLVVFFGPGEWGEEELKDLMHSDISNKSSLPALPAVTVTVAAVEYLSYFSYFILKVCKK